MRRARVLCAAVIPMARIGAWLPVAATAGLATVAFAISVSEAGIGPDVTLARVRFAALLAGLGAGFVLDEPAEASLAASPTPLAARRLMAVGLVSLMLIPWWLVMAAWGASLSGELPRHALTLELAAIIGVSFGAAALGSHCLSPGRGGVVGAGALLVLGATALLLPASWTLYLPTPLDPGWVASHLRWATVGGLALAVLACTSRDPARRRRSARSD
jgi:hypothetical protein